LETAAHARPPYDLLLLDGQMPGMSGLEVLQAIRLSPHLKDLPVIMLTSVDNLHHTANQYHGQIAACLTKPVKQSQLLKSIQAVFHRPGPDTQPTKTARPRPKWIRP
jgi:CheY-like chemotaxis protein